MGRDQMRAFLAISVSGSPALEENFSSLLSELRHIRGLKGVAPHQLHFTLKFFEDLPENRLAAAKEAAARAAAGAAPFSLRLSGLGTFPEHGPTRVLWVGCAAGSERLVALASDVEKAFAAAGFPAEKRAFNPHLTLARVKDPRGGKEASRFAASHRDFEAAEFEVKELVLYQSVLGPSGPAHTPLGRLRFGT